MQFYIQPIYSKNNGDSNDLFFKGEVKKLRIDDNYNNLSVSGNYWITSNALLPSYSYYLDINTEFGQILNIPLFFSKQIEKVNKPSSNNPLYTVDEYNFNFNLSLTQSSYFNEYIKYKIINFNIVPMFNQTIVNDFNVQTNTSDLQKFIIDINQSKEVYETQYSNLIELEPGNHRIWLNKLNTPNTINIDVEVNKFNPRKIFNQFICLKNITSKFNLLSTKIKLSLLNSESKTLELSLDSKLYADGVVDLNINRYITYDESKNMLVARYIPGISGIFIDHEISIQMDVEIKFEYMKCKRIISINQYLNFNNYDISDELKYISFKQDKSIELSEGYIELENEKIF